MRHESRRWKTPDTKLRREPPQIHRRDRLCRAFGTRTAASSRERRRCVFLSKGASPLAAARPPRKSDRNGLAVGPSSWVAGEKIEGEDEPTVSRADLHSDLDVNLLATNLAPRVSTRQTCGFYAGRSWKSVFFGIQARSAM
ncbi:hypothetical protein KM043_014794 [Ampulex compressa]|nr:hypothetical protein KM043_014794 [Ampulex compressa]